MFWDESTVVEKTEREVDEAENDVEDTSGDEISVWRLAAVDWKEYVSLILCTGLQHVPPISGIVN
jgi:hypothetical protein